MAAPETICFAQPAQLKGSFFRLARGYVTAPLPPLRRRACLLAASRLALQTREAKL